MTISLDIFIQSRTCASKSHCDECRNPHERGITWRLNMFGDGTRFTCPHGILGDGEEVAVPISLLTKSKVNPKWQEMLKICEPRRAICGLCEHRLSNLDTERFNVHCSLAPKTCGCKVGGRLSYINSECPLKFWSRP